MSIWKEKAGVISKRAVWCCSYDGYLHVEESFWVLIWSVLTEWKDDKHLVG